MAISAKFLADFDAFVASTKNAENALKNLEGGGAKLGKSFDGFFSDMSGGIVKVAAGFVSAQAVIGAVGGAFRTLKAFIGDSVTAFSEADAAQVKLVAALRQHGLATPEVIAQYNELGATFQRTTRYSDDQINSMQGLLTQIGSVMPSQMAGALKASTDLAAGLGIDLESATRLVAKAAAGHTETLGKYGITVSKAALDSKGFEAVLEAVNRQFGGQAAAEITTYAGKVEQIGNSWNNVQEIVGKILVQNPFAEAALRVLGTEAARLDTESAKATSSLAGLAETFGLPGSGILLATLEAYVASLNEAAAATDRINKIPTPFEFVLPVLPPITAGMKLFNEELAESAKQAKAAEVEAKAWSGALLALANDGLAKSTKAHIDWQDGIQKRIDDGVVQRTASIIAGGAAVAKAEDELADFIGKTSLDTLNYEIANIWQRVDQEELAFKGSEAQRAQFNAAVEALATAQAQTLRDTADAAAAATEAAAAREVAAIKTVTGSYWEQIDAMARASGVTVVGNRPGEGPGINGAKPTSGGSFSFQQGGATDPKVLNYLGMGFSLGEAQAMVAGHGGMIGPPKMKGFAGGGPVLADGPIYAHAGEFVLPKGGGGSTVTNYNTIYVNGTAEDVARKVAAEIARSYMRGNKV